MLSALAKESLSKMGFKERRVILHQEVSELRSDLDNIKDAHHLVRKEIKGIRRAMKLLIASYRQQNPEGNSKPNRKLTEQNQMIRLPTEYSRNIDMESICGDLPILEPLSDDDILFGEHQDAELDLEEHVGLSSFQRRQSIQFGSPSPPENFIRRTSPTRASIQFGSDFGIVSPGFMTPEDSRPPRLASMAEDEQDETDYTTSERDTPDSIATSEDSTSLPNSNEHYDHLSQRQQSGRSRFLTRRSTVDMIDADSLRWSTKRDWEEKQYIIESIQQGRLNPGRKRPPLRRQHTQPNLLGHAEGRVMNSSVTSRRGSSVSSSPLDGRGPKPLQIQALSGHMSPTSPRSPTLPRQGLIGSPLTTRRASAAAAAAAAAALTKHHNHLRKISDVV
ncbi:uncharacterized protein LOC121417869 isoform X2 [Lytechinus variegatus]|nr:uncharacterized protein LOC121417869 isoform X2 [Lytechinus variegatus]XP_041467553.1 uncharacterized protein LOC121417869 isoform X2 [Lytechinus variegatus]